MTPEEAEGELRRRLDDFLRSTENELEQWESLLAFIDRGQELIYRIKEIIREFREENF